MRSLLAMVALLVATGARTESKGHVTPQPVEAPGDRGSMERLLEHMVRSQLEACPGVEVHKRGRGFIAGKFEGPIVIVSSEGRCSVVQKPDKTNEAIVSTKWSTQTPEGKVIAVLRRELATGAPVCPTNFMTPELMREAEPAVGHLCREAFEPLREPWPLQEFFFSSLSPLGTVRMPGNDAPPGAVVLQRGDRTFELSGTLFCQASSNEIESPMFGSSSMRSLRLVADLVLREPATGAVLGQWREQVVTSLGISCDTAFRLRNAAPKLESVRTTWEERFATAIAAPPTR